MKLTWLGHSCFLLEQDGYRVAIDPYTGVDGYPPLRVEAHAVYCSHQHADHNAVQCVTLLPRRQSPFSVREVPTFHDERQGAQRGKNTVRIFTAGGVSVAHMGDLGHQLTDRQRSAIGPVDAVLIPVGGYYTIDAAAAKAVCDALSPRCIVPMHYCHPPYGLPVLGRVEAFTSLFSQVRRLDGPSFELTASSSGVIVPAFGV